MKFLPYKIHQQIILCLIITIGSVSNSFSQFAPPSFIEDSLIDLQSILITDINKDSYPDVVYRTSVPVNQTYYVNINLGNGKFDSATYACTYIDAGLHRTADINGDGWDDLVITDNNAHKVIWKENLKNNTYGSTNHLIDTLPSVTISNGHSTGAYDMDNDGDIDIISTERSLYGDYIYINWNNGNGTSWPHTIFSNPLIAATSHLVIADFNSDSYLDIVAPVGNNVYLFYNNGNQTFTSLQTMFSNPSPVTSVGTYYAEDIDGDNDQDLIISQSGKIDWIENIGAPFFTYHSLQNVLSPGARVKIADLNLDGKLDIAFTKTGRIMWIENITGNTFKNFKAIDATTGMDILNFHIEDMNKDGDPDLITHSKTKGQIGYFENFIDSVFSISGKVFFDANQNKQYDSTEIGLSNLKINVTPNNYGAFSIYSNKGKYSSYTDNGGHYISHDSLPNWMRTTDSAGYSVDLSYSSLSYDNLNFGFYPSSIFTKFNVDLTGGLPRCNNLVYYYINIENKGTNRPSGVVQLILDDEVTYQGSNSSVDSIAGDTIYWHYDSLQYFSSKQIIAYVKMPTANSIGDTLKSFLTVTELDTAGIVQYSRSDSIDQILVCAFDPNLKVVTPTGISSKGYIPVNSDFEYTVHFQNTGNDTAFYVRIEDQLDTNLDWNTFQPISSSHDMITKTENSGLVIFEFHDIELPDSNVNEPASHGYVKYSISMKPNLKNATKIYNAADIFFDLNPPITTDSVLNTVFDCNRKPQVSINNTTVCQNDSIFASANENGIPNIKIWEINGFYSSMDSTFKWQADTAGSFDLKLTETSIVCQVDTSISININPTYDKMLDVNICQGDSAFINGAYRSSAGIYSENLLSINGCDSTVNTTLIIDTVFNTSQSAAICNGDSLLIGGVYRKNPGAYIDNLLSAKGCDSIVTTNLTVNLNYFTNSISEICQGDSLLIYGQYESSANIYFDSLQSSHGCDSVLSTTLFINPTFNSNSSMEICDGDSTMIFGTYQHSTGIYFDSLQSKKGCDSVLSVELLINDLEHTTLPSVEICYGESLQVFNNSINQAGIYFDTLTTQFGCDSVLKQEVAVNKLQNSVNVVLNVLSANPGMDKYQWYKCDPWEKIDGEVDSVFTAVENGEYAVVLENEGCVDTSACYDITSIGIFEIDNRNRLKVYPNPVVGNLMVYSSLKGIIELIDYKGSVIAQYYILEDQTIEVNFPNSLANGIYLIRLTTEFGVDLKKIVLSRN